MSLELLRSLDPAAAPAKGAVRLRPTVPGDAAMATLDERVGQSFDAVVRTETNASSADASPRRASPLEAPAQEGRPRVAVPRAGDVAAPQGVGAPTGVQPPSTPSSRPVPLVADEAPREHRSSSVADKAPREHRSSSVAVASTAAVKPAAVPALRESPRAPLHPSRAALLAPASTARAQSVPSVLHVTIDRIDVRSAPPSATPTPRAGTARPAPSRSLADYLRDSGDASSSRGGPRA